MKSASATHVPMKASGYVMPRGHLTAMIESPSRTPPAIAISRASAGPSTRRLVMAAPTALPTPMTPAAARLVLPFRLVRWRRPFRGRGGPMGFTRFRSLMTISVACSRSRQYISCISCAKPSFSIVTSSSQLPIQLATLRLVEPTRAHLPSTTEVFAWIIGPFHSKTRTPASRSAR